MLRLFRLSRIDNCDSLLVAAHEKSQPVRTDRLTLFSIYVTCIYPPFQSVRPLTDWMGG